jgi:hypothetical protein
LALRHHLAVLQRSVNRPRLARWDRVLWVWLSRRWTQWRSSLLIVQPATVLAGHRRGFLLSWRWKSRAPSVGRPRLDPALRYLIRRMARENPTWGRRRIRAELARLGDEVAELTVAQYMHRTSPRPSPTWRVVLTAHARAIVAVDFLSGSIVRDLRYAPTDPCERISRTRLFRGTLDRLGKSVPRLRHPRRGQRIPVQHSRKAPPRHPPPLAPTVQLELPRFRGR